MKVVSNDIQLNVTDTGVGDTALVIQHHLGGSSITWSAVIARLRDRFRCIAIDGRGAGASDVPATGYSTENYASDALNVIQSLGLKRYILVGHSMGGKSSQLLASQRPQGLLGLVLVASALPSPMVIDDATREQMRNAYNTRESIEMALDNALLSSPVSPEIREQLITDALRVSPEAKSGWIDIGTRDDISKSIADVDVPVLILAGEQDHVDALDVVKAHIVSRYPSARVYFLPNKGHLLPVEAPQEVADLIGDFASGL